jgi:hypothetical protein
MEAMGRSAVIDSSSRLAIASCSRGITGCRYHTAPLLNFNA